jgi:hypothetical protein
MMQSASADLGETNIMGKRDVHVCTPSYGLKQKKTPMGLGYDGSDGVTYVRAFSGAGRRPSKPPST